MRETGIEEALVSEAMVGRVKRWGEGRTLVTIEGLYSRSNGKQKRMTWSSAVEGK